MVTSDSMGHAEPEMVIMRVWSLTQKETA